jgi:glycosyltransferase involved in cell wall biosynthesis
MNKKLLYIFTEGFPCQAKSELYLKAELPHLCKAFDKIYLVPSNGSVEQAFELAPNCEVIQKSTAINLKASDKLTMLRWALSDFKKLVSQKLFFKLIRYNLALLKQLILNVSYYESLIKPNYASGNNIYLYAYWLSDCATTVALLKKKMPKVKAISRAHGYDVFENQTAFNFIPFRKLQFTYLDKIYSVSKYGAEHLKSKQKKQKQKVDVAYLGTHVEGEQLIKIEEMPFSMASCSIIREIKRLHLMIDILSNVSFPITWHVIGDGDDLNKIKTAIKNLPNHIKVIFHGFLTEMEIVNFYKTNSLNLFISLSRSEGLPVSMMEAQSFGIPIMSTNVGGCSEICNEQTGLLIEKEFNPKEVAQQIEQFKNSKKNTLEFKQQCKLYWEKNFNAEVNYKNFAKLILEAV